MGGNLGGRAAKVSKAKGGQTGRRSSEVNQRRRPERAGGCTDVKGFRDVLRSEVVNGLL